MQIKFIQGTIEIQDMVEGGVALDGAVRGPCLGSPENGDRWSFDHHDEVIRLITTATCEQVLAVARLGFSFEERAVYVNDLDGDTVLASFIASRGRDVYGQRLTQLVHAVGVVDTHGPAGYGLLTEGERKLVDDYYDGVIYPVLTGRPGASQERFAEWGDLLPQMHTAIGSLLAGDLYIPEKPEEPLTVLHSIHRTDMVLAACDGFGGFIRLYGAGSQVVCLTGDAAEGTRQYTIGKISDLQPTNFRALFEDLNAAEAEKTGDPDCPKWGGGSSIGGSPRGEGGRSSVLTTDEVWEIMLRHFR